MLKPIFNKLKIFKNIIAKIDKNWLAKNPDPVIWYDIIQN